MSRLPQATNAPQALAMNAALYAFMDNNAAFMDNKGAA